MNKYIDYDIHNGLTQLKCAIMNILKALNASEINYYSFTPEISKYLIEKSMKESGWVHFDTFRDNDRSLKKLWESRSKDTFVLYNSTIEKV